MDPKLEKYFDDYNVMFNQDGWKLMEEEIVNRINALSDLGGIHNTDEFLVAKGQVQAFRAILSLPDVIQVAREQAEVEPEDDVQDI